MILINLLPHREAKRKARLNAFRSGVGLAALVGVVLTVLWFAVIQQMTAAQEARNTYLKGEIVKLDADIKSIANLRSEIDALKARQKAVEDLQTDRNVPVLLLNELVNQVPEGIYLTGIKQVESLVSLGGMAQTNERVSELLRNLAYNSSIFERPELIEIKAESVNQGKAQKRLFLFSVRVKLKRSESAKDAADKTNVKPASGSGRAVPEKLKN